MTDNKLKSHRVFHGTHVEFSGEGDYKTELDRLEARMFLASQQEYELLNEPVKYEAEIIVEVDTSVKVTHHLKITVKRNGSEFRSLSVVGTKKIDKASSVREMIRLFDEYARLTILHEASFIIYNDYNDLKNIEISRVSHNNRDRKYFLIDPKEGDENIVIFYKDVIGYEDKDSPEAEMLKDWRGTYYLIQRDHAAIKKHLWD